MNFNEYQQLSRKTAVEWHVDPLVYLSLGLVGEAGEVANKLKKMYRDEKGDLTPEVRSGLREELGDTMWYLAMLADEIGLSLYEVAQANVDKLARRAQAGSIRGAGDGR